MRRLNLGFIVVAILGASIPASAVGGPGLVIGYTSSHIEIPRVTSRSIQRGGSPVLGVSWGIHISDDIYIEPELTYCRRSSQFYDLPNHLDGSMAEVSSLEVSADYIELPLLARFGFKANSSVSVLVGPAIGFVVSSEFEQDQWQEEGWATDSDLSAIVGLGYARNVGAVRLGVEVSYRHPLSRIGEYYSYIGEVKVSGFSVVARATW